MVFSTPTHSARRWHVLVVDDSLIQQRLATGVLSRLGLQATVVNNGQEAVVAARDFPFDLILMDVEMPVLDGCEATRQIRALEAQSDVHVPIVAVTSLDDRQRVLNAGMDAYLSKPLSAAALDEILRQLVAESACC